MLVRRPRLSARSGQAVAAGLLAAIAAVVLLPACPTWLGRGGVAFAAADSDKQNQPQPSPATLQTAPPTALHPVIAPPPSAAAVVAPPVNSISSTATIAGSRIRATNSDTLELSGLENRFAAVAERVAPSVVAISASISPVDTDDAVQADQLNGQRLRSILDRVTRTVGTGLVIDGDGYILTNEHVVADAEQLWCTTDDKRVYPAVVVATDPRGDLAVLKIPAKNLPVVHFAEPGKVRRGQWTIALGNPYGLAAGGELAMSVGVVSALDRSLPNLSRKENRVYSGLIQTTAEINPGNSGGPLFDVNGDVIGVTTAVILPQKQVNGIGFAMPVTQRMIENVETLKSGREVVYAYMGVTVTTPSPRERRQAGVKGDAGVVIEQIEEHSPAAGALKLSDMLMSIDGHPVDDSDVFVDLVGAAPVDRASKLGVYRNGKLLSLDVQMARRQLPQVAVTRQNQRMHWRGMLLGPIPENWTADKTRHFEGTGVMVLAVNKDSPMLKQGVTSGSIIVSIGGKRVSSIGDLQSLVNDTPAEQCAVQLADGPQNAVASAPLTAGN